MREGILMRQVPAEEFQDRTSEYLDARETLAIERNGQLIGHYVPVGSETPSTNGAADTRRPATVSPTATPDEWRDALEEFDRAVKRVLNETGMTEDELADLFDLNKPFPYD